MNSNEFVSKLLTLAPTIEKIMELWKVDETTASETQQRWLRCEQRNIPLSFNNLDNQTRINPIVNLFSQYNLKNLYIGVIHFNDFFYRGHYIYFASFHEDNLSIDCKTYEIKVVDDYTNPDILQEIFFCAKSGEAFLEMFLLYAHYARYTWIPNDEEKLPIKEYVIKAVEIAGGERYYPFIKYLFQYNEEESN